MTSRPRKSRRVNLLVLLLSAAAWVMLLFNPGGMTLAHCHVTDSRASLASVRMMLEMNPTSTLAAGWALMLVAMMSPTLLSAIHHVRERSFKRRRARSVALFAAGYAAVWMAAGALLMAAVLLLNLLAPQSYLAAAAALAVALVWQSSPVKQRCLNRGHNHGALAAFGARADLDALRFGVTHGVWCVGSCWALMLLPMLSGQWHLAAMAAVTYVMISERLEQPRPLGWRLRFPGKLMRILFAQSRIRLRSLPPGIRPSLRKA